MSCGENAAGEQGLEGDGEFNGGRGRGERNRELEKQREREGKSISECVCVIGRGWYPQLRERVAECRHGVGNYDVMKISFPLIS